MLKGEHSFGIVPLRRSETGWEALMVCHPGFWWFFPKGHAENGELPQATAARELSEETGLSVTHFFDVPPLHEAYHYRRRGEEIDKQVTYFLAEVDGAVSLQEEEVVDAAWVPLSKIEEKATYPEGKSLCREVVRILKEGAPRS